MRGRGVHGHGAIPGTLGAVLIRLGNSLHGAVDVAFSGSSGAGRRAPWLRQAGQVEFRDAQRIGREEMALYFEAAPFGEVAQDYYAQPSLIENAGPKADDTAFDALADAAADVQAERADSQRYDAGLLRRFHGFGTKVLKEQVSELDVQGHRKTARCSITSDFAERAARLYQQTPRPARARIAGRLDMVQASTFAFSLLLESGEHIRGAWLGKEFETLRAFADTNIVVSGMAVYRPSGALLRIDAETLLPQSPGDKLFASIPSPRGGKLDVRSLVRSQQKHGGLAAVWGKVPAEESDEEFLDAVAGMD